MALHEDLPPTGGNGRARKRKTKIGLSLMSVIALIAGLMLTGWFTGSASAHTPNVSASCDGVVVNLTDYVQDNTRSHKNTVSISVDGAVVESNPNFGTSYSKTVSIPQDTSTHTWAVDVTSWDNVGEVHRSGTVGPCVKTTKIDVPAQPDVTDPCGEHNATWILPADTDKVHWSIDSKGNAIATITAANTVFSDGLTSENYGIAPDSNEACPPVIKKIEIPSQASVKDPCGPDNATWVVPADTDTISWMVNDEGHLIATITAENTEFTDGTTTHDYGVAVDSGQECPPVIKKIDVPAAPDITDPCGPNNATWVLPADTDEVHWSLSPQGGNAIATIVAINTTFKDGTKIHDYGTAPDSGISCPPTITKIDVPATPAVTDPCGLNNATWVVPADTDVLNWTLGENGHLVVDITAKNTQFQDGTTTHDYGTAVDSGKLCPVKPIYSSSEVSGCNGYTSVSLTVVGTAEDPFAIYGYDGPYQSDDSKLLYSAPGARVLKDETVTFALPSGVFGLLIKVGESGQFYVQYPVWEKPATCVTPPVTTPPVTTPPVTTPVVTPPVTTPVVTPPVTTPVVTPPVTKPPVTTPVVTTTVVKPPVTTTSVVVVVPPTKVVTTTTIKGPYPTDSHNGGPGERLPVGLPLGIAALIAMIGAVWFLRRRQAAKQH
ncbi:MAG: hypothetical protein ABIQ04_05035 [Candidatus Saccharimonadales bacterium]